MRYNIVVRLDKSPAFALFLQNLPASLTRMNLKEKKAMLDIGLIQTIAGIILIIIGLLTANSAWNVFNNRAYSRSAEKLAPVIFNLGVAILGVVLLFRLGGLWPIGIGLVLLLLGYLMRSPLARKNR